MKESFWERFDEGVSICAETQDVNKIEKDI
jgi:hypothetical protein